MGLKGNGSRILDTHRQYAEGGMPLSKGKSEKSFVKNLKTEMEHGKPQKQSLAIAYAMKRKAQRKKMADGGPVDSPEVLEARQNVSDSFKGAVGHAHGGEVCPKCGGGMMAGGGFIGSYQSSGKGETHPEDYSPKAHLVGEMEHGYVSHEGDVKRPNMMAHSEDDKDLNQHPVDTHAETDMHEEDLVDRIMENRKQNNAGEAKFSEGGEVANQDEIEAGFSPNEFDDLHLRDDLSSSYGEDDNSGDALGNKQEDEDRADLVDRIMLRNFKQKIRGYPGR
jgi:hypothetical protein